MKTQRTESYVFKTEGSEPSVYLNTYNEKYDIEFRSDDENGNSLNVEIVVPISQAVLMAEKIVKRNNEYLESLEEQKKESANDE
jgi:hypothetical protein